ncbi:MAG: serine hydrolase [Gemmataceae bacterium]
MTTTRLLAIAFLWLGFTQPRASADAALESRVQALVKAHKGKVTIAVKHLLTGETLYIDADDLMPTASLIKFPVMLEAYKQAADGKINLADKVTLRDKDKVPGSGILTYHFSDGASFSVRDAIRLMIVYSDNTATNLVLDKICIPATGKRMKAWGFPGTKIHAKVFRGDTTSIDPEGTKKYGLGSTTAREMAGLFEKLHEGKLISPEATKAMLDHLKNCDDKTKLKRLLPAGTVVAHKTGSVSDVKTDAGIIYAPSGPIAICVLTWHNTDRRFVDDNAANVLIGRVAREVFDAWGKKK